MKKAKNILLLSGICLYVLNVILEIWTILPSVDSISKPVILYIINSTLSSFLGALIIVGLQTVLLFFNLKNKHYKIFSIVVSVLSGLSAICALFLTIDIGKFSVLLYWLTSIIGLNDTYFSSIFFGYFLPDRGLLFIISFFALALITVGAIMSCKKSKE